MDANTNIVLRRRSRYGLLKDTRGANLVEYIILVGVIAIVALAAFSKFGKAVKSKVKDQTSEIKGI